MQIGLFEEIQTVCGARVDDLSTQTAQLLIPGTDKVFSGKAGVSGTEHRIPLLESLPVIKQDTHHGGVALAHPQIKGAAAANRSARKELQILGREENRAQMAIQVTAPLEGSFIYPEAPFLFIETSGN